MKSTKKQKNYDKEDWNMSSIKTIFNMEDGTLVDAFGTIAALHWGSDCPTKSAKRRTIKELIYIPDTIVICDEWASQQYDFDKTIREIRETIYDYLYESLCEYVGGRISGVELEYPQQLKRNLLNDRSEGAKHIKGAMVRGYILAEYPLLSMSVTINETQEELLENSIDAVLEWCRVYNGQVVYIDEKRMDEKTAKMYIEENGLKRPDAVPLTRECFMHNITTLLDNGKEFYVTPSGFGLVQYNYETDKEGLLPYSFCKKWLENDKDRDPIIEIKIGKEEYNVLMLDEDIMALDYDPLWEDDIKAVDIIDNIAKEKEKYIENLGEMKKITKEILEDYEKLKNKYHRMQKYCSELQAAVN